MLWEGAQAPRGADSPASAAGNEGLLLAAVSQVRSRSSGSAWGLPFQNGNKLGRQVARQCQLETHPYKEN